MMKRTALDAHTATMTDQQIVDALVVLDHLLDGLIETIHDLANNGRMDDAATIRNEADAHRLVRVALIERLEARHPWLDEIVEAWCDDDNDHRGYVTVLRDALTALAVI